MQTFFINVIAQAIDVVGKFQSVLFGLRDAAQIVVQDIGNFFNRLSIDTKIVFEELRSLNPFASEREQGRSGNALFSLRQQRKQFEASGKSVSDAFFDAYTANEANRAKIAEDIRRKREEDASKKRSEEAAKLAAEEAKKAAEARAKAIEAANKSEEALNKQRLALLAKLGADIADITIQNIQDLERREIEAERLRFDRLKAELQKQEAEQVRLANETRSAIAAAYGERSREVLEFERTSGSELISLRQSQQAILEANETKHTQTLVEIQKKYTESRAAEETRRNKDELDRLAKNFAQIEIIEKARVNDLVTSILRDTSIDPAQREAIVLGLKFESDRDALERERIAVVSQIEAIKKQIEDIDTGDAIAVSADEYGLLLDQLAQFNLKRSELERKYTDTVLQQSAKRTDGQLNDIETVLSKVQTAFGLLSGFISASAAADRARVDEQLELRSAALANLESRLEASAGRERQILQSKIDAERAALEKLDKEKQRLEKEEARRRKRFAIIDSIISTALAVVAALRTIPAPNIPAATIAGVTGAAQTALIAAQPAATGGLVGGVKNQGAGLVVATPNIPTLANGDNVLATIKRGEVVLNKRQQMALGGPSTFRALRVPGFAEGGVAGAPIGAPDLSGVFKPDRLQALERLNETMTKTIEAINSRIDRLQVFVVSEDVRDDLIERDALQAQATFQQ